jgi:hypothetical protein
MNVDSRLLNYSEAHLTAGLPSSVGPKGYQGGV